MFIFYLKYCNKTIINSVTMFGINQVYLKAPFYSNLLLVNLLRARPWSSLVEGGEGSYLSNCQTTLVIALDALSLLFCIFINTTVYHLGRYILSAPWPGLPCRLLLINSWASFECNFWSFISKASILLLSGQCYNFSCRKSRKSTFP